jgi:hypothetical protein
MLKVFVPLLLLFSACTDDISQLNIETKRPAAVPAPTLFSNATKTLAGTLASASVNTNVFRFTVSHWAMAVYQDEAQYDFNQDTYCTQHLLLCTKGERGLKKYSALILCILLIVQIRKSTQMKSEWKYCVLK